MNVDVTVAHRSDRNGAAAAFVYEDLDRELSQEELIGEAVADMAVDYPGFVTEVAESTDDANSILIRAFA